MTFTKAALRTSNSCLRGRINQSTSKALLGARHLQTTENDPTNPTTGSTTGPTQQTHFGFRTVDADAKEDLVKGVFSSVAPKYDLMNDAMSLGVHRLWKDEFVTLLNPGRKGPVKILDMAGGTGDIALRLLDHAREKYADRTTSVLVSDINPDMLKEGRRNVRKTMYHGTPQIDFQQANAQELPPDIFPDNSFDLYTIAFGIRNCTSVPDVLKEAHRVLKPGGTFACLEFGKVGNPLLSQLYETYSFSVIPLLGTILASDRDSYQYLVESIRRFPTQPDFAQMIQNAGFSTGGDFEGPGGAWRDLWGGIASVHLGVKV
ncbi:2-hexaprenyl-6-methoxy-1,4-benzoquinone methyltransferase [Tulasnella sp. JGI-2019a]|nr:2-hexaprenyl-6-methoxy-1,4-benzoquinone methyltransferase [Tulasnella sp. JGI-2019a]KAG8991938.1 2-hexaprenyl-6-methoxy-1,4-benzoquinone methyltransferase [Tulasnella sp. JGI-2019a]KAG9025768.1 2-hexaprenyl-6-methoxy-1,4-benzoquinone methyltransferase [Tulasnella sp. JGI-2019a]